MIAGVDEGFKTCKAVGRVYLDCCPPRCDLSRRIGIMVYHVIRQCYGQSSQFIKELPSDRIPQMFSNCLFPIADRIKKRRLETWKHCL